MSSFHQQNLLHPDTFSQHQQNSISKIAKVKKTSKKLQKHDSKPDKKFPKYFISSCDKQYIFKETAAQFREWCSWQKRILLCKCIERIPLSFLIVLNTTLEPVLHRDYQVLINGGFQSSLIRNFLDDKKESWKIPIAKSYKKEQIVKSFVDIASEGRSSPFDNFRDPDLKRLDSRCTSQHTHALHRKMDSISTIDFLLDIEKKKTGRKLGEYMKPSEKSQIDSTLKDYKQKKLWLPPINSNYKLQRISKESVLQQFRNTTEDVLSMFSVWSNPEKGEFLLYLIDFCPPEDVRFLSNCIFQSLEDKSDMSRLPDKVMLNVFNKLNIKDIISCSMVCRRWNSLASNDLLWKKECYLEACKYNQKDIFMYLENLSLDVNWKTIFFELNRTVTKLVAEKPKQTIENVNTVSFEAISEYEFYRDQDEEIENITPEESHASSCSEEQEECSEITENRFQPIDSNKVCLTFSDITAAVLSSVQSTDSDVTSSSSKKISTSNEEELALDVRPKLIQPENNMKFADTEEEEDSYEENFAQVPISGLKTVKRVRKLEGHSDAVLCIQFGSKRIMTGSSDRTVRLWDARSGRNFRKIEGHQGGVRCLQFDQNYIITGSWDTTIMIWHAIHYSLVHTITEHKGCVSCMELTSKMLVTGSHDATICIFEKDTWNLFATLKAHEAPVSCLLVLTEEEHLLSGSYDRSILLWNIFEKSILRRFSPHSGHVNCLKLSGKLLAAGSSDGTLTFWDFISTNKEGVIKAHNGSLNAVCFIGAKFITGGSDHLIKEWDLATCTCLRSLNGHKGAVLCLRASNKRILSGSADGTARLWDFVCSLQQIGGPYDDMNKIIIKSQVVNENQFKKMNLLSAHVSNHVSCHQQK